MWYILCIRKEQSVFGNAQSLMKDKNSMSGLAEYVAYDDAEKACSDAISCTKSLNLEYRVVTDKEALDMGLELTVKKEHHVVGHINFEIFVTEEAKDDAEIEALCNRLDELRDDTESFVRSFTDLPFKIIIQEF